MDDLEHYCTCKSGARAAGSCAHVLAVLMWDFRHTASMTHCSRQSENPCHRYLHEQFAKNKIASKHPRQDLFDQSMIRITKLQKPKKKSEKTTAKQKKDNKSNEKSIEQMGVETSNETIDDIQTMDCKV